MKFEIQTITPACDDVRVGNVYAVRGGYGMRDKHMNVLVSITENQTCIMLTLNKEGNVVDCTKYGIGYLRDRMPIAYADGVEEMFFTVRSI